jgi:tetratricopeptide (TPR) repeat protein
VYDWLAPEGVSQEKILASWNDDTLEIPSLAPVIAPMHSAKSATGSVSDSRIAELEKLAAEEASAEQKARETALIAARAAYQSGIDAASELRYALAAFRAGKNDEALAAFNKILAATPDDAVALAYRGSLVSMTARDASPLVAVDIVTRAYADLDRAVALAKTPDEIITVRTNRANVSQSVPETVFGKALQGAEDWLASAEANKALATADGTSLDAEIAGDLLNAALCFETAGKPDDAGIWFREAARIANARPAGDGASGSAVSVPGVPAWIRLELAKRGLLAR